MKKFLDNFEGYFCVATLSVMSVVIFWQVVCRYVLKGSLPWSEELSRYLLIWTTFIGGAYGVKEKAHLGVDAFILILPKKVQAIIHILVDIVSMVLCGIICYYGFNIVVTQLDKGQLSPAMRIPMGYMYAAIPVGMVLFVIRYLQNIIKDIKALGKKEVAK